MKCPKCASTDCWDDNAWWGCNACGWMGDVPYEVARQRLTRPEQIGDTP
jgi:hypothetical protein